jgi:Protein of unknown function (DUF4238)
VSQPRKQHYLPQFYLRGFSLDGRGLHQIEKLTGKHYGCQIKDAAAIKDFHELDYEGSEDPHALEKQLAGVEGEFARYLAIFLSEGVVNEQARLYTIQLLSLMRLRVPAFKDYIESSYPSIIRKVAESMEHDGRLPAVPPGLEERLRVKNLKISLLNWKCMEIIFNLAARADILSVLYKMRVTLFDAAPGTSFVTSDQPVALFHADAGDSPYGIGLSVPGIEISLPLSSRTLLRLDHKPGTHASRIASFDDMAELNRRTVAMARKYVFAASDPENFLELAAATRDIRAGFVFDDIDYGDGLVQVHRCIALGPNNR